jgi:hypothetical protein
MSQTSVQLIKQYDNMSKQRKFAQIVPYFELFSLNTPGKIAYFIKTYGKIIMALVFGTKGKLPAVLYGEIFSFLIAKRDKNNILCMQSVSRIPGKIFALRSIKKQDCFRWLHKPYTYRMKEIVISRRYALVPEKQLAKKIKHITTYIKRKFPQQTNVGLSESRKQFNERWDNRCRKSIDDRLLLLEHNIHDQQSLLSSETNLLSTKISTTSSEIEYYHQMLELWQCNTLLIDAKYNRLIYEDIHIAKIYKSCSQYYRDLFQTKIDEGELIIKQSNIDLNVYRIERGRISEMEKVASIAIRKIQRQFDRSKQRMRHKESKRNQALRILVEESIAYTNSLPNTRVYKKHW